MRLWAGIVAVLALVGCSGGSGELPRQVPSAPVSETGNAEVTDAGTVPGTSIHCGYERWAVKTGSDPAASSVNLTPQATTVAQLDAEPQPAPIVTGQKRRYPPQVKRLPAEMVTVTVHATLRSYAIEQDNDLHLVIQDGRATMIAEIPNPLCVRGGPFLAGIEAARQTFIAKTGYNPTPPPPGRYNPSFRTTNLPVTITGVVFYDFIHGQTGVAPNGIEIHPVTALAFG